MLLFGVDPRMIFQGGVPGQGPSSSGQPQIDIPGLPRFDKPGGQTGSGQQAQFPRVNRPAGDAQTDDLKSFISVVLADTEDVWNNLFKRMGRTYQEPKLVLFSGAVQSRCGLGQSACNPVLTTLANFRPLYDAVARAEDDKHLASFDIHRALHEHESFAGRESELFPHDD